MCRGRSVPPPGPKSSCANSAVLCPVRAPQWRECAPTPPEVSFRELRRFRARRAPSVPRLAQNRLARIPPFRAISRAKSESTARQCEHSVCYSVSTASEHLQPPRSPAAAVLQSPLAAVRRAQKTGLGSRHAARLRVVGMLCRFAVTTRSLRGHCTLAPQSFFSIARAAMQRDGNERAREHQLSISGEDEPDCDHASGRASDKAMSCCLGF